LYYIFIIVQLITKTGFQTFLYLLPCVSRIVAFFVIFIIQMFGSSQKLVEQKPLKRCQLSICLCLCMYVLICLQAREGRCAKNTQSSYWLCKTKNTRCGSCILTTKRVTQTNYYNTFIVKNIHTKVLLACLVG